MTSTLFDIKLHTFCHGHRLYVLVGSLYTYGNESQPGRRTRRILLANEPTHFALHEPEKRGVFTARYEGFDEKAVDAESIVVFQNALALVVKFYMPMLRLREE
jgi:hypothetical protein